jgi:hypothetical protein
LEVADCDLQSFTEHGVAMLSAVLNSVRAVHMSILIVRAFVKLRRIERIEAGFAIGGRAILPAAGFQPALAA